MTKKKHCKIIYGILDRISQKYCKFAYIVIISQCYTDAFYFNYGIVYYAYWLVNRNLKSIAFQFQT